MAEPSPAGPNNIQVKASEEALRGKYSSHMQVLHTREEFILDFMLMAPPIPQLVSRVIVSPPHFKRMVRALSDNLAKYEKQFGKVESGASLGNQQREVGFQVE